jgi:hypothetical protein
MNGLLLWQLSLSDLLKVWLLATDVLLFFVRICHDFQHIRLYHETTHLISEERLTAVLGRVEFLYSALHKSMFYHVQGQKISNLFASNIRAILNLNLTFEEFPCKILVICKDAYSKSQTRMYNLAGGTTFIIINLYCLT